MQPDNFKHSTGLGRKADEGICPPPQLLGQPVLFGKSLSKGKKGKGKDWHWASNKRTEVKQELHWSGESEGHFSPWCCSSLASRHTFWGLQMPGLLLGSLCLMVGVSHVPMCSFAAQTVNAGHTSGLFHHLVENAGHAFGWSFSRSRISSKLESVFYSKDKLVAGYGGTCL